METLFENAPSGYFAFDNEGITLVVNETLTAILERSKRELVGQSVQAFFTLPTRIFFQTHLFPMIKLHGHADEIFVTLLTAKGKHLPVLLNAKKMEWEGKQVTCCSCILVPNRKKFEDELVAARKMAETALRENTELLNARAELQLRTEQLERQIQLVQIQNHELQQFSHVVTHSLKEPLRKILMYTGKIVNETTAPSLLKLVKANEQMKAVVSGFQQYVWLNEKANDYTPVDLNALVQEIATQLKQEVHLPLLLEHNSLPTIEGDREQLKMLLHHLLSNSVKFRRGDSVQVKIEGTVIKRNRFRSVKNKYDYKDFVRLEIVDKGIGFDAMYADYIFELFRKFHQSEGLGLGLALCKKIVDNHRGHIEAQSELNEFTKMTVWLPLFQSTKKQELSPLPVT
jgi:sigma-B regulation protein RsbU (phosphoserine phosphatase)